MKLKYDFSKGFRGLHVNHKPIQNEQQLEMTLRALSKIIKMVERLQIESDAATFQQSIPPLFSALDRLTARAVQYMPFQHAKRTA